jgi:CRISPR/Cas system-associated protein Csm6
MVNLPLDMLVFFFYKMDYDMLECNLEEKTLYAGKTLPESKLLVTMGHKASSDLVFYGFEDQEGRVKIPFTLEVMEDGLTVKSIQDDDGFIKDKNVRTNLSV